MRLLMDGMCFLYVEAEALRLVFSNLLHLGPPTAQVACIRESFPESECNGAPLNVGWQKEVRLSSLVR